MAAFNFPDPAVTQTVKNPITGSTYQWKEPPGKWVVTVSVRDVGDIIWEGEEPPNPVNDYKLWYSTDTLELYFYYTDTQGTSAWIPTAKPITGLESVIAEVDAAGADIAQAKREILENFYDIQSVKTSVADVENNKVSISGDTMTGELVIEPASGSSASLFLTGSPELASDGSIFDIRTGPNGALGNGKQSFYVANNGSIGANENYSPSLLRHLTTKKYVDEQIANIPDTADDKVSKAGDTMSGTLDMSGNKLTGLASPVSGTDAMTYQYWTDNKPDIRQKADRSYVQTEDKRYAIRPAKYYWKFDSTETGKLSDMSAFRMYSNFIRIGTAPANVNNEYGNLDIASICQKDHGLHAYNTMGSIWMSSNNGFTLYRMFRIEQMRAGYRDSSSYPRHLEFQINTGSLAANNNSLTNGYNYYITIGGLF